MSLQLTKWCDIHVNTKRKLIALTNSGPSGLRSAVAYFDWEKTYPEKSIAIYRNRRKRIIGWGYACPFEDGLYLMVYVDRKERGKGHGTMIVRSLIEVHKKEKLYCSAIGGVFFGTLPERPIMVGRIPVKVSWKSRT